MILELLFHNPFNSFAVLALAILIDGLLGDPTMIYRWVRHPIVMIGGLIGSLEQAWNKGSARARRFKGVLALLLVLSLCGGVALALSYTVHLLPQTTLFETDFPIHLGGVVEGFIASIFLAGRSLYVHVKAVAEALVQGLDAGREAVGMIVGRDPSTLDEPAVARAAVESLAENFSDGFVAPAFWFMVAGLPGLVIYKAINTADSMVGYKSERYLDYGWASARLDDLVNWIPARLAGLILCLSAILLPYTNGQRAYTVMLRDALHHRSPNAGWLEAAMAGALNLRLNGPKQYGDQQVDDAWMGDGEDCLNANHIRQALKLMVTATMVCMAAVTLLAL